MRILLSPLLFAILPIGAATAKETPTAVELYYHVSGPAIETHSLRLLDDGTVISETYDWRKSGKGFPHKLVVLCKLKSHQKEAIVSQAASAVSDLSHSVKTPEFISIDGPYKAIRVRNNGKSSSSILYEPESTSSPGTKHFKEVWEQLSDTLNCGTKAKPP